MVISGLFIGGGVYVWNKIKGAATEVVNSVKGGEISEPNMENWAKLKIGMTVDEAQELLGSGIVYTVTSNDEDHLPYIHFFRVKHIDSSIRQKSQSEFDNDGKLVKWNEPKQEVKNEVTSLEKTKLM